MNTAVYGNYLLCGESWKIGCRIGRTSYPFPELGDSVSTLKDASQQVLDYFARLDNRAENICEDAPPYLDINNWNCVWLSQCSALMVCCSFV